MLAGLKFSEIATVLFFSIVPSMILLFFILYSDRKNREPAPLIAIALISGLFTISLSLMLDKIFLNINFTSSFLSTYNNYNLFKIIILAFIEEFSKWFVLYVFLSHNSAYDEIYDGFVYSSIISLSFAFVETLMYVFNESSYQDMTSLAVLRNLTSVPLHIVCGIIMGYHISLTRFSKEKKRKAFQLLKAIFIPTFVHSLYNIFFSLLSYKNVNNETSIIIMALFVIGIYILGTLYTLEISTLNKIFTHNSKYEKKYNYLMNQNEFLLRSANK